MLYHARDGAGQRALEHLETFFFHGHDRVTGLPDSAVTLDVETQALLRLLDQVEDTADTREDRGSFPPLCVGAADLLADDVTRLLCYERFIPRSVMVDYLKVLFSFHLALYHLRLLKLLPALVRRRGGDPTCGACPWPRRTPRVRTATVSTKSGCSSTWPPSPGRPCRTLPSAAPTCITGGSPHSSRHTSRPANWTSSPRTSLGVASSPGHRAATSPSAKCWLYSGRIARLSGRSTSASARSLSRTPAGRQMGILIPS